MGKSHFWNHFVIEFTDFGADVLQMRDVIDSNKRLSLTRDIQTNVISNTGLLDVNDAVQPGNILNFNTVIARDSCLKFLDHRKFIQVESHLPYERNLMVINGQEQTDMSILRCPINNRATATITCEDRVITDNVSIQVKNYVGRVPFQSKTEPVKQWNRLQTAFGQRVFRFQIYCVYNVYNLNTLNFDETKIKVPFDDFSGWSLSIRFVSKL